MTIRFAQVTDLHLSLGATTFGPDGDATLWVDADGLHERIVTTPAVLAELFAEIHAAEPGLDFVAATGDLTNNGLDAEFAAYCSVVAAAPVRIVSIPGNHDHHAALAAAAAGDPLPYERFLGPRWFSFDEGGVHVVAMDWFTHRLGFDTEVQERWLADDLLAVPADVPVVLLSHDQMPAAFFDRLPRRPAVTLSGHWHTNRVATHDGTIHVNTGPATFAGLDYCPAHYRVVSVGPGPATTVDTVVRSRTLRRATVALAPRPDPGPATWLAPLGGGAHLAGAVVAGDVVIATGVEEGPAVLAGLDLATGERRWEVELPAAVKSTPRVAGDVVVACTVTGEVLVVDVVDGTVRWRTNVHPDPLHLWAYVRPLVHDGIVFAGDVGVVRRASTSPPARAGGCAPTSGTART